MPEISDNRKASKIAVWLQAVRAFSFPASLVPVFVGTALAFSSGEDVAWMLLPLVVICSVLFQAGTNVVSDYFDFINGVDKDYTYGSSRVLVEKLLEPKELLVGGLVLFATGILLGFILIALRGWPMLIIGVIGFLGGLFYTAKPVGYKYIAIGDIMVFILMGPLMVLGSFLALTGKYHHSVLLISLPVGFLVAAILFGNNLRDIKHDTQAGVKTIAALLGHTRARFGYYILIAAAYIAVILMTSFNLLSIWSLLVIISCPLAIKNIKAIKTSRPDNNEIIAMIDVRTAQLHMAFGVLFVISMFIDALIR